MSRPRIPLLPKKREAFVAIRRFMCDSDITLKAEEEIILDRWIYCDALLKAKDLTEEEIIDNIAEKFGVSVFTARHDITNTQRLFADARKINKKYLIHHHLDRIDRDIQYIRKKLFGKTKNADGTDYESSPDAKDLAALAKLFESYTYTLNSVPEETTADKQPPPIFQFILAPGQQIDAPLPLADALTMADGLILKQNPEGVYEAAADNDEEQQ